MIRSANYDEAEGGLKSTKDRASFSRRVSRDKLKHDERVELVGREKAARSAN